MDARRRLKDVHSIKMNNHLNQLTDLKASIGEKRPEQQNPQSAEVRHRNQVHVQLHNHDDRFFQLHKSNYFSNW